MSANLSRTWSSGSASIYTAAWSAQGSDTWCTVSPVRKSLHRERCGTEQYRTGQLRCFQGDLDGKRGLPLAVVESTRYPPASRSCLTSFSSSPPMGMGPTTPSTTGRGIRAPMEIPPGSLSGRASLLCWASVAHPMSHFPEGSGLTERTAPTALLRSWLRCHGPSLSNLADPPSISWITTGKSTNAGARVLGWNWFLREMPSGWLRSCCSGFPGFLEGYSCLGLGQGWFSALLVQSSAC